MELFVWMNHTLRTDNTLIVSTQKYWVEEMVNMSPYVNGPNNPVDKWSTHIVVNAQYINLLIGFLSFWRQITYCDNLE